MTFALPSPRALFNFSLVGDVKKRTEKCSSMIFTYCVSKHNECTRENNGIGTRIAIERESSPVLPPCCRLQKAFDAISFEHLFATLSLSLSLSLTHTDTHLSLEFSVHPHHVMLRRKRSLLRSLLLVSRSRSQARFSTTVSRYTYIQTASIIIIISFLFSRSSYPVYLHSQLIKPFGY